MKAPEVYRTLRDDIAPWAKAEGFKRAKTMLSWYRPSGEQYVVFWFQVSQDGWDEYAGSKFVVEFQLSAQPVVGEVCSFRQRIAEFLDGPSREEARRIQNRIICSIKRPPTDYWVVQDERFRDWYLSQFEPDRRSYSRRDDIWFRYYAEDHLHLWSEFTLRHLPRCVQELEAWAAQARAAAQKERPWWRLR